MHQAVAGDERPVLHHDMAPEQRAVGDDHVIGQPRVMPYVTMRHQKIARADDRFLRLLVRPMHRDVFAENVVVTNAQPGRFFFVFQVLRRAADHAAGVKRVVGADGRVPGQMRVRPDGTIRTHNDVFINERIRSDAHRCIHLRPGMDDRCRMNHL